MEFTSRQETNCADLIKHLEENPKKAGEAKQFLLDWMTKDTSTLVNPEEGIVAIEKSESQPLCQSKLYKEWMQWREEMFSRFWAERIIPSMSGPALVEFFKTCGTIDLGAEFEQQCLDYLCTLE